MARSTRLVILIKKIYTLWGRKRFLLPVTYFPTNLVYRLTIRVTGIITELHRELWTRRGSATSRQRATYIKPRYASYAEPIELRGNVTDNKQRGEARVERSRTLGVEAK